MTDSLTGTYSAISRANHWIVSIAFFGMLAVGFYLEYGGLTRETRGPIMVLHKATGTVLLLVVAWRVIWRLRQGFPAPVAGSMAAWQVAASKAVHLALLAVIVVMPLSGVLGSLFGGRPIDIYGLFTIAPFEKNETLQSAASFSHTVTAYVLTGLIAIHVAAAIKHHLIDKDATLARMISGKAAI
jgi:cytochrome b561